MFGLGTVVDSQGGPGDAKQIEWEFTGHKTGGFYRKLLGVRAGQFGKEDVLRARD
ncbi:hypothetical protein D3C76_1731330 [compost metagenome]